MVLKAGRKGSGKTYYFNSMTFVIQGGKMNDIFEIYKKELNEEIRLFLKNTEKLPKNNPVQDSEWKYSKETYKKLNSEIKDIYTRLQKKYNIKNKDMLI